MTDATADSLAIEPRFSRVHFGIAALCLLAQFVDGFDYRSMSLVAPTLAKHWHIARSDFGPVFGASATGILVGGLLAGPVSDRIGRKSLLIGALLLAAVLMIPTVWIRSLSQLAALRLACSFALGAIVPLTIVLANEWSPPRHRSAMVLTMCAGYSLGSALSPFIVSALLQAKLGWRSVFYTGAAAGVMMAVLVFCFLPESAMFLRRRAARGSPGHGAETRPTLLGELVGAVRTVPSLFREQRGATTAMLWACLFLTMIAETFLTSWLPTLFDSPEKSGQALSLTGLMIWGGIAATVLGGLASDRLGPWRLLIGLYVGGVAFMCLVGGTMNTPGLITAVLFATGFCVIGSHHVITALAANLYPTDMKATGTGWAIGVGRIGSIVGPLLGGVLIGWDWPAAQIFPGWAVFAAGAGLVAIFLARAVSRRQQGA